MNSLLTCPGFVAAAAGLTGMVLGRLANRCIDVFPRHESLSHQIRAIWTFSPHETVLRRHRRWFHMLPVAGWLLPGHPMANGKRAWAYALVEVTSGLLVALLAWSQMPEMVGTGVGNGLRGIPDQFAVAGAEALAAYPGAAGQAMRFLLHVLLVLALLVASVVDLRTMTIPDGATLPAIALAVLAMWLGGNLWLVPVWYENPDVVALVGGRLGPPGGGGPLVPGWIDTASHWHGLLVSLAGLVVGGGTVWSVRIVGSWALGREAMGFGDVVLMALVGSVIGWQPAVVVFFLAPPCAIAAVMFSLLTGKARELPFGPWLSLATVLLLVGWPWIWLVAGQFFLFGRFVPILGIICLALIGPILWGMRLIRGHEPDYWGWHEEWNSADQLCYQSQENPVADEGRWQNRGDSAWPGIESARGTLGETIWHGSSRHGR